MERRVILGLSLWTVAFCNFSASAQAESDLVSEAIIPGNTTAKAGNVTTASDANVTPANNETQPETYVTTLSQNRSDNANATVDAPRPSAAESSNKTNEKVDDAPTWEANEPAAIKDTKLLSLGSRSQQSQDDDPTGHAGFSQSPPPQAINTVSANSVTKQAAKTIKPARGQKAINKFLFEDTNVGYVPKPDRSGYPTCEPCWGPWRPGCCRNSTAPYLPPPPPPKVYPGPYGAPLSQPYPGVRSGHSPEHYPQHYPGHYPDYRPAQYLQPKHGHSPVPYPVPYPGSYPGPRPESHLGPYTQPYTGPNLGFVKGKPMRPYEGRSPLPVPSGSWFAQDNNELKPSPSWRGHDPSQVERRSDGRHQSDVPKDTRGQGLQRTE